MDWAHLHLALNHIPVFGPPFVLVVFLWSWWRRESRTLRFCLVLFVALAVASIAIKFTGDFAAEQTRGVLKLEEALVEQHEQTADQASTGVFLLGLAALGSLVLSRGGRPTPAWAIAVVAVLTLGTLVLMARTANSGGLIRHPEIRPPING